jgi:nucleoside-diphosphate-sugar epimerase
MRALVTGATGMVGRHITDRLLTDGWKVRALVRNPALARDLAERKIELVSGDVLDGASFSRAAGECDVIFHAAAEIITRGGWETFRAVNVDGTRHAIAAAAASRARLLQVSSVAVYGSTGRYLGARTGGKTSEDVALQPLHERAYYARSKRESEELVMEAHRAGRIWAAAVRPVVIYGRRDRQFVPRIARALRYGLMPLLAGGRATMAVVHAANVADGAVLAATHDAAGGRAFNLANDFDVTVREFFSYAADGLGRPVRFAPVPLWMARVLLRASKSALRVAGRGQLNMVSGSTIDFLTRDNPFTSERARRELGWCPAVRPEVGVRDAFAWWRSSRESGPETQRGATW